MSRSAKRQDNPLVIIGGVVLLLVAALGMVKAMRSPAPPPRIVKAPASHAEEVPERQDFADPKVASVAAVARSAETVSDAARRERVYGPGYSTRLYPDDEAIAQSMAPKIYAKGMAESWVKDPTPEERRLGMSVALTRARQQVAGLRRMSRLAVQELGRDSPAEVSIRALDSLSDIGVVDGLDDSALRYALREAAAGR